MEPFAWTPSWPQGHAAGIGRQADGYGTVTSYFFPRSPFRWCSTFVVLQWDRAAAASTRSAKRTPMATPRRAASPRQTRQTENAKRLTALAENIANATCTPFLGSGASAPQIPTGGGLAADWARRFRYPFADTGNLARVMQYVAFTQYSGDEFLLKQRLIREHFHNPPEPDFDAPYQVHKVLAECSLPLYVTTNYDDFMFRALERRPDRQPLQDISPWYVSDFRDAQPSPLGPRSRYRPSASEPLVFHLHGHHSLPASLVLTENDNIEYLIRHAGDARPTGRPPVLPPYVRGRLRDTSLLFLGYSVTDWTFHVLFRRLLYGAPSKRNHVSVQIDPTLVGAKQACRFVEQYLSSLNIWIFWDSTESFMRKLVT